MPKGNRSEKRGHRPKLGGAKSKGTSSLTVKMPVEVRKRLVALAGDEPVAAFVRRLIEKVVE